MTYAVPTTVRMRVAALRAVGVVGPVVVVSFALAAAILAHQVAAAAAAAADPLFTV